MIVALVVLAVAAAAGLAVLYFDVARQRAELGRERERLREFQVQATEERQRYVADIHRERQRLTDEFLERMAQREQAWDEERRNLLDRIQAPGLATSHLIPDIKGQMTEAPESDSAVDAQFRAHAASRVEWDDDLAPIPAVDGRPENWVTFPDDEKPQEEAPHAG